MRLLSLSLASLSAGASALLLVALVAGCDIPTLFDRTTYRWVRCEVGTVDLGAVPVTMTLTGCNDAEWEGRVLEWNGERWIDPLNPEGPVVLPDNLPDGVPS